MQTRSLGAASACPDHAGIREPADSGLDRRPRVWQHCPGDDCAVAESSPAHMGGPLERRGNGPRATRREWDAPRLVRGAGGGAKPFPAVRGQDRMPDRRRLNVVIAGPGETGEYLARRLVDEDHDVTMLDVSSERLADLEARLEVRTCLGHGGSTEALRRAGVTAADVFVATSNRDDVNLVSALKARQLGARWTAALVEDVEVFDEPTGFYPDFLGIDRVMNTRFLIAREIAKLIRTRGILAIDDIAENHAEVVQFQVAGETGWTGRPLSERLFPEECLLVALRRQGELRIPQGPDAVLPGDEVLAVGTPEALAVLEERLGHPVRSRPRCLVMGGGTVGLVLCRHLEQVAESLVLIEREPERCQVLARELPRTTVLLGDGTDIELLREEAVGSLDVFAAVSGEDERNIIAARLAREMGARRAIALVSRPAYVEVCQHLGLEVAVSPRVLVAREVLRMVVTSGLVETSPVMGGAAELMEAVVSDRSRVARRTLREANLPRGVVVAGLVDSSHRFRIPHGDSVLEPGFRAILFGRPTVRTQIQVLFRG